MSIKAISEAFMIDGVWHQDYMITDDVTGETEVKRYKHNGIDWVEATDIDKQEVIADRIPNTNNGIKLKKSLINFDKSLVDLSNKSGINLSKHSARVAVVLDFSGSMRSLYSNGSVQNTLNRIVPLSLRFDDNGELDVWLFHDGYRRLESVTLDNFDDYIENVALKSGEKFGLTRYSPVIEAIYNNYVLKSPSDVPAFVIFITDGANSDRRATDDIIRKTSYKNIFIQFVGIGDEDFDYLKKLDNLKGREVDNTGFIKVSDFDRISDDELYQRLLEQYIDWLKVIK